MIIKNPGLTVVCTLATSTLVLAYILRVFEIEYYRSVGRIDFDNYFQSVWVIVVTMTTVGFGDLVPYSYVGRLIIMITSFWGAFLISLVIVSVSKIFELTRNQKKAMHHLFLTRKAASSITSAMRYFMAKKRAKKIALAMTSNDDSKRSVLT
jgi:ABC-type Fe3+-siderophore transport system permease subunit